MTEPTRAKLREAIAALLDDGPLENRLAKFDHILLCIKLSAVDVSDYILEDLEDISEFLHTLLDGRDRADHADSLTKEEETELTNRLFSAYIEINGGGLIF